MSTSTVIIYAAKEIDGQIVLNHKETGLTIAEIIDSKFLVISTANVVYNVENMVITKDVHIRLKDATNVHPVQAILDTDNNYLFSDGYSCNKFQKAQSVKIVDLAAKGNPIYNQVAMLNTLRNRAQ